MQELLHQHQLGAAKRQLAAQQLIEHDPQAVDVAPPVGLTAVAPLGLLRAHVRRSPDDLAIQGHDDVGLGPNGQAEVDHDRLAQPGQGRLARRRLCRRPACSAGGLHHDVGRLDVAMDEPALVGVVERQSDVGHERGALAKGQPPRLEQLLERHPVDEVGDLDRHAVDRDDLVKTHDPRVPELSRDPRFPRQPLMIQARIERVLMGDLQRDDPVELGVARRQTAPNEPWPTRLSSWNRPITRIASIAPPWRTRSRRNE